MAYSYRILIDGAPLDPITKGSISSLEVEENVDLPGAIELTLPVASDGASDYTMVNDDRFKPFANLAVEVSVEGRDAECIFDGYVLSQKVHLDRGTTSSTLKVWGQDASCLMNLEEKTKEWPEFTDGAVANAIFGDYGFATAPENTADDSAAHSESGHTLMQRGTDIQFLRRLARKNGKICRVAATNAAGTVTGWFVKPKLDAPAELVLALNGDAAALAAVDITWDVARPTAVVARQALFTDPSDTGVDGGATSSDLPLLGTVGLDQFAGRVSTALLTTPADDAGELQARARALLGEAGFFVRCTAEVELDRAGGVLRAGSVAELQGAGAVHSGNYYVWSVRHQIQADAYKMTFVLYRNGVQPKPPAPAGFPGI